MTEPVRPDANGPRLPHAADFATAELPAAELPTAEFPAVEYTATAVSATAVSAAPGAAAPAPASRTRPAHRVAGGSGARDSAAIDSALFAWEWARLLAGTSWIVDDRTVVVEQLRQLTEELASALTREPFVASAGIRIGERLVAAGFVAPDSLACTVTLLSGRLLADLRLVGRGGDAVRMRARLDQLVGMVSHGFVRAVRDQTLDQQEAIRSSAFTAWRRAEAALRDQQEHALRDPLTGLPNRAGFAARVRQLLISADQTSTVHVCLLDLDGFTAIDRGLGRSVGDELLTAVAGRLAARFGGADQLVARVGGDEFAVLVLDRSGHLGMTGRRLAAAAQEVIRAPIPVDGQPFALSATAGLVAHRIVRRMDQHANPLDLLRDCDLASSWARSTGAGAVAAFDPHRAAREIADLALAADLPVAIAQDAVTAYYQPIISLADGTLPVVEALARWPHPRHGLLLPHRFLDLADRTGLIVPLGRVILRRACMQARIWLDALPRPPLVSVNLAPAQVADPQTVADVAAVLQATGLPASQLQLEITEHAALAEPAALGVIGDLAELGVELAIDDFGTGRAHLAQLPELPAHGVGTLKLPSQFLAGLDLVSGPRVQVLSTIIDLAHDLGMVVTVEGVETPEQDELVRLLGADQAQGWHYARPGNAASIGRQLADGWPAR